jgi:hypothetical protein
MTNKFKWFEMFGGFEMFQDFDSILPEPAVPEPVEGSKGFKNLIKSSVPELVEGGEGS